MFYYNLFITAVLFVLFMICIWNLLILRNRKYAPIPDDKLPFVSVLVPARNEELNIESVLNSLLSQDYPNYELIVLNDSSTDSTGEIIQRIKNNFPDLTVLNGKPLEEGWTGKCFACRQLYEASKGDFILFTDADTVHKPGSLRDSLTIAVNRRADMLTLFPEMTMVSAAEKLLMPMLMFTLMTLLPLYFTDKKGYTKFSAGIGPFMLFSRKAYETIGTHSAVKSALVEDVWLSRKIKEAGLKLVIADGSGVFSVRMYRSLKDIWNGFSKNIFAGLEFSTLRLIAVNAMYFLLFVLPFILFASGLSLQNSFDRSLILITGLQVFILYLTRFLLALRFKLGFISTLFHPAGALMVSLIALNSWRWIKLSHGARWKGRTYNTKT